MIMNTFFALETRYITVILRYEPSKIVQKLYLTSKCYSSLNAMLNLFFRMDRNDERH